MLVFGILRALLFILSYAPADGADASDYYAYAAYIAGFDISDRAAVVSPIFPLFIFLTHYVFGSIEIAVIIQVMMSATLGVILYLGLRRYDAFLGFLVGIIVMGDPQIGVLFGLMSTEPLYIFLICLAFSLAVSSHKNDNALWKCILLGIVLFLLTEIRTVGSYLFYPFLLLYAFHIRDMKRILLVIGTLLILIFGFIHSMNALGIQQVSTTNMLMYSRPLVDFGMLQAENGTASFQLSMFIQECEDQKSEMRLSACIEGQLSSERAVTLLYRDAYIEMILNNSITFGNEARSSFYSFMRMTGIQYSGDPTPAVVQCANIENRAHINANQILTREWASANLTLEQESNFRDVILDFSEQFCPPWVENSRLRNFTDLIARFYNFLSPSRPYILNMGVIGIILVTGWARRFWFPYLLAITIWVYHALISTLLFNVQPRYIVVTNPMRAIYISLLIFFILKFILTYIPKMLLKIQRGKREKGNNGTKSVSKTNSEVGLPPNFLE